jgi:hypothetical protein
MAMSRGVAAAGAAALALTLYACGSGDAGDERLDALEAELAELRGDGDASDSDGDASDSDGTTSEDQDAAEAPADADTREPVTIDVGEVQATDDGTVEVTVERMVVHDYHVEVELTAVNDDPEDERNLWRGGVEHRRPLLFDEQDRRFEYQHPAGYDDPDHVSLAPGQRVEAVLVFGRRLHPDAQTLTLRFQDGALEDLEWTVELPEARR